MQRVAGVGEEHLKTIEARYGVTILPLPQGFTITGGDSDQALREGAFVLEKLCAHAEEGGLVTQEVVRYTCDQIAKRGDVDLKGLWNETVVISHRGKPVRVKTQGQRDYLNALRNHVITFATGPAGTGKTYLAVCQAARELKEGTIQRVVLVRPAVEAGERLGYLPGDLRDKVEPYLRPLYDAFYDLLSPDRFTRLVERGVIEIASLAYMRGRTLNESFVILDEAQNTTPEQMKMFLTRTGFGSKVVVTGDLTQVDLPGGRKSGLAHAVEVLKGVEGLAFVSLTPDDVVRHEIVQRMVEAYDRFEGKGENHD